MCESFWYTVFSILNVLEFYKAGTQNCLIIFSLIQDIQLLQLCHFMPIWIKSILQPFLNKLLNKFNLDNSTLL